MMNMKKLIDQTDFDNLSELTKRWSNTNTQKQSIVHQKQPQKQNDFKKSNEIISSKNQIQTKQQQVNQSMLNSHIKTAQPTAPAQRKNKVVPQVIDQDTEHFKNKLQHLLNNFKIDAVSQFMNMKKQMLQYQQQCVKTDTHKYLTMYEQKHKELIDTKQKLLEVSRDLEKKNAQVQLLSDHIAKLNERIKINKYVSRPFSIMYQNMLKQKQLKFKMKEAQKFDQRRLKRKSLWTWIRIFSSQKKQKQKTQNQERIQRQVNEIVGKFQKQMQLLKQRLAQATKKNEQYQNNKHLLQQNLKKAFLRGVCAMNMQAMGVLSSQNAQQSDWNAQKASHKQKSVANNYSFVQNKSMFTRQQILQNQSMVNTRSNNLRQSNPNISNENVIIQPPKAESKNFKWKEAPILGVQQVRQEQQPRMQVIRPTTEGKVIKVVEGKSAIQPKKIAQDKLSATSIGNSRKKF